MKLVLRPLLVAIPLILPLAACTTRTAIVVTPPEGLTTARCDGKCEWTDFAVRCEGGASCLYTLGRGGVGSTKDGFGKDSNIVREVDDVPVVTCLGTECRLVVTDVQGAQREIVLAHLEQQTLREGDRVAPGKR